jgi:hypothetical protein
MKKVRN